MRRAARRDEQHDERAGGRRARRGARPTPATAGRRPRARWSTATSACSHLHARLRPALQQLDRHHVPGRYDRPTPRRLVRAEVRPAPANGWLTVTCYDEHERADAGLTCATRRRRRPATTTPPTICSPLLGQEDPVRDDDDRSTTLGRQRRHPGGEPDVTHDDGPRGRSRRRVLCSRTARRALPIAESAGRPASPPGRCRRRRARPGRARSDATPPTRAASTRSPTSPSTTT